MIKDFDEMAWEAANSKKSSIFGDGTLWSKYKNYNIMYKDNPSEIMVTADNFERKYNPFDFYPDILVDYMNLTKNILIIIGIEHDFDIDLLMTKPIINIDNISILQKIEYCL